DGLSSKDAPAWADVHSTNAAATRRKRCTEALRDRLRAACARGRLDALTQVRRAGDAALRRTAVTRVSRVSGCLLDDHLAVHDGPVAGERAVEGVVPAGLELAAREGHRGGLAAADDLGVGDHAVVVGRHV